MDNLGDCLLSGIGLMLISNDLDLVTIFISFVWKLYLDVKVTAYLGDVGPSLANNLGVVLAVNVEHKCETTQFLQKREAP